MMIGNYENFTFENALHKRLYTQDKVKKGRLSTISDEAEYQDELETTILNRKQLKFLYSEYLSTYIIGCCCCCCGLKERPWFQQREKRAEMHEEANDRLSGEIDILDFI